MNPNTARLAAVVALVSGISCGTTLADTMTGSLVFGGDPTNWYDPVAAGCCTISGTSNATANSPTVTLAGGTTATFGYQDLVNTYTASFTAGQLDIENILGSDPLFGQGAASWTQTFTASITGFFTGWTLASSNFDPFTLNGSLDPTSTTLTVTWGGTNTGDSKFDAIFTSSPVPGPIVGAGLPGLALAFGGILAWRRRKREMV